MSATIMIYLPHDRHGRDDLSNELENLPALVQCVVMTGQMVGQGTRRMNEIKAILRAHRLPAKSRQRISVANE